MSVTPVQLFAAATYFIRLPKELSWSQKQPFHLGPPRRLGGPRANTKSGTSEMDCVRRGLGARPQEIVKILFIKYSELYYVMRIAHAH